MEWKLRSFGCARELVGWLVRGVSYCGGLVQPKQKRCTRLEEHIFLLEIHYYKTDTSSICLHKYLSQIKAKAAFYNTAFTEIYFEIRRSHRCYIGIYQQKCL